MERIPETRLLPRDIDCERYVLGTLMSGRNVFSEIQHLLSEECFYDDFHRRIYRSIAEIEGSGEHADILSVKAKLEYTYPGFDLARLSEIATCLAFMSVGKYAARLDELRIRRQFFQIANYLEENAFNEVEDIEDVIESVTNQVSKLFSTDEGNISTFREGVEAVYRQINLNMSGGERQTGTPTGFSRLDGRSGGLQPTDLFVIAGETSSGKTSLAVSMMLSAAKSGAKVAMYSMEMREEQVVSRIMSMESGVPANEILYSCLTPSQLQAVDNGVSKLPGLGIYFDDRSTSSIDTIISSIRYMKMRHGITGAVIDYLQILNVNMKGASKEEQMADVARRLKNLAKDLEIWIIALSQLNRDKENAEPSLGRLRGSGQIEDAADVIAFIYRPETKNKKYSGEFSKVKTEGTALINIAKGRNIGLMKFIVGFDARLTKFYEYDEVPLDEYYEDENPF